MGLTFYWRVRSSDGTNLGKSPWTVGSFVTNSSDAPLDIPTLDSPLDNSTNTSIHPTITWNGVAGAVAYKLWLSGGIFYYVYGTSIRVADLAPNHYYTWNVTPLNCNDSNYESVSTAWHFTTGSGIEGPEGPGNAFIRQTGESDSPTEFTLRQNYPNPFNPTTRFDYALPSDVHVSLKIYNTLGQVVATLVDEFQSAGWKSAQFDAKDLPSGIYFYVLRAGNFSNVKKMMLVK